MKQKYFYTIHRAPAEQRTFEHIWVRIYLAEVDGSDALKDELFTLTWQGDSEADHWYGFHVEMRASYPARALEAMKHAQLFLRKLKDVGSIDNVLGVITTLGIERRVYDDRYSLYKPIGEIVPNHFQRWMAWMDGSCVVDCVTDGEQAEAQCELMTVFAKQITERSNYGYGDKLERWIAAGKPVRQDTRRAAPDVRSLDEIAKPMKAKAPEKREEVVA